MSTILVSTICRNETRYLDRYHAQLRALCAAQPQHTFLLSIYENDSTDGSAAKLAALDWSFLPAYHITTARMQTPPFIGGKHPLRVQLLAAARNRSIYHCGFLHLADRVLVVEPDVAYPTETAAAIIEQGMAWDVFSGKSVHPDGTGRIYDSWGTRKTDRCTDWADGDQVETGGLEGVWSTYHCFCTYAAEAFKQGARFHGVNPRTKQPDCDTVAVVEDFRQRGFNRVAWNRDLHVVHSIDT
jgi:hypothetical protein